MVPDYLFPGGPALGKGGKIYLSNPLPHFFTFFLFFFFSPLLTVYLPYFSRYRKRRRPGDVDAVTFEWMWTTEAAAMRFWSAVGWAHSIFFRAFLVVFPCNFSSLHIHPRSSRNFLPFTFERWGVTKEKKRKEKIGSP